MAVKDECKHTRLAHVHVVPPGADLGEPQCKLSCNDCGGSSASYICLMPKLEYAQVTQPKQPELYMCTACKDRLHDLCEDGECECNEAEHENRPD